MTQTPAITYSDVLITPKYSEVESRSKVDLTTTLGSLTLQLPVITANMRTITGATMATCALENGAMGILHRFSDIETNTKEFNEAYERVCHIDEIPLIGVSIGIKEEDKRRFESLYAAGARTFCIDIAHGHHVHMKNMIHWMENEIFRWSRSLRKEITIIAGNVATGDAYYDLAEWGADVVKVGIGPGHACQTRKRTGVGVPQLQALMDVHDQKMGCIGRPAIIADGGIRHVGDIAKALKYADAVMLGSFFAGCSETPGNVFRNADGDFYKVYGGSASGENKGSNAFIEGITTTVKFQGHAKYLFKEIREGVQSACSYVGANNLKEFKNKCEFIPVSTSSAKEGHY